MPMSQSSTVTVNSTTAGTQSNPAVVTLEDGRQMMVWVSDATVRGAFVSPAGAAGTDFLISDNAVAAGNLSLTADAGGGFSVEWATGDDFVSRTFTASGTPAGSSATVATNSAGEESNAVSTFMQDGQRLTAWYDNDGTTPMVKVKIGTGAEFQVSGTLTGSDKVVSLAMTADGGFVVAWKSGTNVIARKYDMDGVAVGAEFNLNTSATVGATGGQVNIIALSTGGFLATWTTESGTGTDIEARLYDAAGEAASAVLAANSVTANAQSAAHAVQLSDGRIMMVWQSSNGANTDIHARLMDATGGFLSEDWVVAGGANDQTNPKVALMSDGRVSVTFGNNGEISSVVIDTTKFYGEATADLYTGGAAADTVYGFDGDDAIGGGGGVDRMYGGNGNDTVDGGTGDDFLYGNEGDDELNGGAGNDYIEGNNGNDELNGGEGDDILVGGAGNDTFSGGSGIDTISYLTATSGITVSLTGSGSFSGGAAGDSLSSTLHSIENVLGTNRFNDSITGSSVGNKLFGYGGDDTLNGGATGTSSDADTLDGGNGNDLLQGMRGNDILIGGAGDDVLEGGDGSDTFRPGIGVDTIDGDGPSTTGAGTADLIDYFLQTFGQTIWLNNSAQRAAGHDIIFANEIENVYGSNIGNDNIIGNVAKNTIRGYGGDDVISGLDGNDTLSGGTGNDNITGGNGDDSLSGEDGNDVLWGGAGKDKLSGGNGFDDYKYGDDAELSASYVDTMSTFDTATDTFQFDKSNFAGLSALNLGTLASNRIEYNTTGAATNSNTRFIFETDTKILWYDADGSGAAAALRVCDMSIVNGTKNSATGTAFSHLDIELI
jgi:Ca2+-binding RTX toxin-like protein